MGIVPVQVYAKQVFMEADPGQADLYSVLFAVVLVGGSLVTGIVADKAGRRVSQHYPLCPFHKSHLGTARLRILGGK
jgi:hypothetical protein